MKTIDQVLKLLAKYSPSNEAFVMDAKAASSVTIKLIGPSKSETRASLTRGLVSATRNDSEITGAKITETATRPYFECRVVDFPKKIRVVFKPSLVAGNEAGVSLKPKDMAVTSDKFIQTSKLSGMLLQGLTKIPNPELRAYCTLLVKYYSKKGRRSCNRERD